MATQDVPWDEETGGIIESIDMQSSGDGPSLRDLLLNPQKYLLKPGSGSLVEKLRTKANTYFDAILADMPADKEKFTSELESLNVQYVRLNQIISEKAISMNVPYIKPSFVNVDTTRREGITIDQYNSSVEQLIGKLISTSKYVADISVNYKEYMLGTWVFSSDRAYVLTLKQPENPIMYLEASRTTINGLLDNIADQYGSST